jgi:diguanylate cyclase (GGDEF)-like protein
MFEDFFPDYSCTTGYSELFSIPDNELTDLNSVLIIVALTENPESRDLFKCCADEREASGASGDGGGEIPFVERILTFRESTSKELDALNKQLGKVAYQDQLTKVYNRWELERNLKKALALAQNGSKFALIFLDIDHFKKVNDTFGHDMGDMVLRSIVNAVKTFIKPNHVFGRWGGEEFLYLLPDVDEKEAVDFAEEIRKEIDDACFVTVRHVTVSIGVTMLRPEDSIDSFVKRADEGLYEAKETGRNKVVLK